MSNSTKKGNNVWDHLKGLNIEKDPGKNMIFFFFFFNPEISIFIGKIEWSMNSEPQRAGGSQKYLQKIFSFSNSTKKVMKLGQSNKTG